MVYLPQAPLASTIVTIDAGVAAVLLVAVLPALCAIGVSVGGGVGRRAAVASSDIAFAIGPAPTRSRALAGCATLATAAGVFATVAATAGPRRAARSRPGQEPACP